MVDIVKITCYGTTETMERGQALEKYFSGMMCCEGSERDRYTNIYCKLKQGLTEITDEEV